MGYPPPLKNQNPKTLHGSGKPSRTATEMSATLLSNAHITVTVLQNKKNENENIITSFDM